MDHRVGAADGRQRHRGPVVAGRLQTQVVVVGGGLSGLYAARCLLAAGISFLIVEARDRLGGRIFSKQGASTGPSELDLGPSWFWPDSQPLMDRLVAELGLARFRQHDAGDVLLEHRSGEIRRQGGYMVAPASFRIAGGTSALTTALAAELPPDSVHLSLRVTTVARQVGGVLLDAMSVDGNVVQVAAAQAIFALPPRLAEASIDFNPPLPQMTRALWRSTPTWMASHAKFVAVYGRPFWRDAGLSGNAQSMIGPMVEIHDATTASGTAALFGFLGIPAADRLHRGPVLTQACNGQLTRLFGPAAAHPAATLFKDWAVDMLTATKADTDGDAGHAPPATRHWIEGEWADRVALAGSETATDPSGFLEGAVHAAATAVSRFCTFASQEHN